jgi:hypothetical protein
MYIPLCVTLWRLCRENIYENKYIQVGPRTSREQEGSAKIMGESAKRYPAPIEDLPKRGGELRIPQKVGVRDDASQRRQRNPTH